MSLQQRFYQAFAGHLAREGFAPHNAARHMWRPLYPEQEQMLGEDRATSLTHLSPDPAELGPLMQEQLARAERVDLDWMSAAGIGLILVPGYTHETLRNLSWHEAMDDRYSPHQITLLHPDGQGGTREERRADGDGLRIAYASYPRSNASSNIIVPELAKLLRGSATVQSWCTEGRKLVFVGYSNGSPLLLELFAGLNSGTLDAGGVLEAGRALVALCGDIGGSYLADDMTSDQPTFLSVQKIIAFAERHPLLGRLLGLGTEQLRADMPEGARSLGHAVRQAAMQEYAPQLPSHLHYFSVAALLPLLEYRRRWWHFNLDDYVMYRQARITDPITVYNDGQVALPDNLIPPLEQVPTEQQHFLGAVRTHHWGVSYRTFNLGNNTFPRTAFYRAMMEVIAEQIGELDTPT